MIALTPEAASSIALLAAHGLVVRLLPDGSIEARAPEDSRSRGARRQAAYRARLASPTVTTHNKASLNVTCDELPAPSPSPSFPPSSPSPRPPTSPPTHTPPSAPPPSACTHEEPELILDEPEQGVTNGKAKPNLPTTPQAIRIATIFHRKLTTPWTQKEVSAYKRLGTIPAEDLEAVESYYAAHWPPDRDTNILRHDLLTFLNNFPGELGRAQTHLAKEKPPAKKTGGFFDGTDFAKGR